MEYKWIYKYLSIQWIYERNLPHPPSWMKIFNNLIHNAFWDLLISKEHMHQNEEIYMAA